MKNVSKTNCRFCKKVISMGSKCGCDEEREHLSKTQTTSNTRTGVIVDATKNVIVKNIDIKFGTLVWFLVKLSFAIIPAAIIITLLIALLGGLFTFIVTAFG